MIIAKAQYNKTPMLLPDEKQSSLERSLDHHETINSIFYNILPVDETMGGVVLQIDSSRECSNDDVDMGTISKSTASDNNGSVQRLLQSINDINLEDVVAHKLVKALSVLAETVQDIQKTIDDLNKTSA